MVPEVEPEVQRAGASPIHLLFHLAPFGGPHSDVLDFHSVRSVIDSIDDAAAGLRDQPGSCLHLVTLPRRRQPAGPPPKGCQAFPSSPAHPRAGADASKIPAGGGTRCGPHTTARGSGAFRGLANPRGQGPRECLLVELSL